MHLTLVEIANVDDPRIAPFVNVRFTNTTRYSNHFIAEGKLVVERLVASDYEVQSLLIEQDRFPSWLDCPEMKHRLASTPIYSLPRTQLEQVLGFDFHRGVMACGTRRTIPNADEICWSGVKQALALIGVTELENLGSLIRSAAAFGIDHVLLGPGTADPLSRRALRVSMATSLKMKYFRMGDPVTWLRGLRQSQNIRTIATTLDASATLLSDVVLDERPILLMMGNEAKGLSPEILQAATDRVTIPMQLGTDSLNVAVAGAVFLYELSRR
jgi:tRNA G18 (ribose-2'-O)-methylase SpoU